MINLKEFVETISSNDVEFITGVPDTLLNDFCSYIDSHWQNDQHIIAANEGNAVALAAGYHLATDSIPLVYMQNSGIGNSVNPLLSLTHKDVYSIPMILLIGWRGDPSIEDHAQHKKQGELTPVFLEAMDVPYKILENDTEDSVNKAIWAVKTAKKLNSPTALIVKKGVLEKGEKESFKDDGAFELTREEAINILIESLPKNTIFVASTGRATRELHALRTLRGEDHNRDFLNIGAMGHTSSIALGLAIARKDRLIVCLDGDSSTIMHLGAIATIGKTHLTNLIHVVLNNGVHESVGGQPSAGFNANLTMIAENSGYKTFGKGIKTGREINSLLNKLRLGEKPLLIEIQIKKGIRNNLAPLKINHKSLKNKFIKDNKKK